MLPRGGQRFLASRAAAAVSLAIACAAAQYVHPYGNGLEPEFVYFTGEKIVDSVRVHDGRDSGSSTTWTYRRNPDGRVDSLIQTFSGFAIDGGFLFTFEYIRDTAYVDYYAFFGYDSAGRMQSPAYSFFYKLIFDGDRNLREMRNYISCCDGLGYTSRPSAAVIATLKPTVRTVYEYQGSRLIAQRQYGENNGQNDTGLARQISFSYDSQGNTSRILDQTGSVVKTLDFTYPGGNRAIISAGCCADTVIFSNDYRPLKVYSDSQEYKARTYSYKSGATEVLTRAGKALHNTSHPNAFGPAWWLDGVLRDALGKSRGPRISNP